MNGKKLQTSRGNYMPPNIDYEGMRKELQASLAMSDEEILQLPEDELYEGIDRTTTPGDVIRLYDEGRFGSFDYPGGIEQFRKDVKRGKFFGDEV